MTWDIYLFALFACLAVLVFLVIVALVMLTNIRYKLVSIEADVLVCRGKLACLERKFEGFTDVLNEVLTNTNMIRIDIEEDEKDEDEEVSEDEANDIERRDYEFIIKVENDAFDELVKLKERYPDGFDEYVGETAEKATDENDVPSGYSVNPEDIHLITKEEFKFGRKLEYDSNSLVYFEKEGTLSEYYQILNNNADTYNVTTLIGDGLRFFGVSGGDPDVVYIRNHILKADFKVTKIESREAALRYRMTFGVD